MRKWLVLIGIVGAVAAFVFFPHSGGYANFPPRSGAGWVAFGDSLTSGYGASDGNDYPAVLSRRLGVPIVNLGAPGNTSADGLARLESVTRLNPGVVLLCFGGNDTLNGVPHEQTFANLAAMIDQLHEAGAFVVLIGVRTASVRDRYHTQFKKLAKAKRVMLVPNVLGGVLGNPSLMSDYVHPNDQGYAAIAERLEKTVVELVR